MVTPSERAELDASGFARLLAFLDRGTPPLAGYESARRRLIDFFRWRGIRDPETYADRTFDRIAGKLADGETPTTEEPFRYVLGVARFIYLEGTRAEMKAREALADNAWAADRASDNDEDLLRDLEACLDRLHPGERRRLLDYHHGTGRERIRARQALAEDLGVSLSSLRVQMYRLRQRIEKCVRDRRTAEMDPEDPTPSTP